MPKQTPEVKEALTVMFEKIFFHLMDGMAKSESYAAEYAEFKVAERHYTESQQGKIARYAAEYFVRETKFSPARLPKDRIKVLKKRAIAYALDRLENEPDQ